MKNQTSWIDVFKFKESKTTEAKGPFHPHPKYKGNLHKGHGFEAFFPSPRAGRNLPPHKKPEGPSSGFDTKSWFYASSAPMVPPNPVNQPIPDKPADPQGDANDVQQILLENPDISAATLVNMLKAKGFTIVKQLPADKDDNVSEADSASAAGLAQVRPGAKEGTEAKHSPKWDRCVDDVKKKGSAVDPYAVCTSQLGDDSFESKESKTPVKKSKTKLKEFNFKIRETAINDGIGPTKFKCILIQEGLGNFKDGFYYTKQALQSGITLFEGKKCYSDHPSKEEEIIRPERSVRDIVGHFESVKLEQNKEGRSMLVADLVMLPDQSYEWARGLVRQAVALGPKYPDKEFVGLSINANGEAEDLPMAEFLKENSVPDSVMAKIKTAMEMGVDTVRVVHSFVDAVSVDLVTEPGAGGKVLEMVEQNKKPNKEAKAMGKKEAKEEESKKEAASEKEAGDVNLHKDGDAPVDSDGDEGHDDADQDKNLIMDMLKKHGALAEAMDEGAMKMAGDMLQAYREMGYSEDEAMKCASHSMKLAKFMQGKMPAEAPPAVPQESAGDDKDPSQLEGSAKVDPKGLEYTEGSAKVDAKGLEYTESQKKIIELQAQVAKLTEDQKKIECEKHLENVLRESGLSRSATNKFRESIGTPKSVKQIDRDFKIFVSAYKDAQTSEGEGLSPFLQLEKVTESSGTSKSVSGFGDCLND